MVRRKSGALVVLFLVGLVLALMAGVRARTAGRGLAVQGDGGSGVVSRVGKIFTVPEVTIRVDARSVAAFHESRDDLFLTTGSSVTPARDDSAR